MKYLKEIGIRSKVAFKKLSKVKESKITSVLKNYNRLLKIDKNLIIKENIKDVKKAKRKNLIDRLIINEKRIEAIRYSINEIIKFKSPIGKILSQWNRPGGLRIKKISTSIGVIGIIYESRPNVTADVAALCLKSGNCAILRGGSEAFNTNKILVSLFREALQKNNIDKNCVQFVNNKNRILVKYLLSNMTSYIDVIVPRGGKGLVKKVQTYSKVPVIGHLEGLCHLYVDNNSNINMATKIVINAKMRRTSICGAVETLLINKKVLKSHGIPIINKLISTGCEVRLDRKINKLFNNKFKYAKENDWKTEYLAPVISIKSVANVNQAIEHILKYGTMHTDGIITNNSKTANIFLSRINSSIATHNVSTQFADGGEFGFGGEIGISTNKLPPRGPVGINQLTSYKYVLSGKGIIRS
tara:strand:- start:7178 stop:8419 length:1242 start_codon:yes stop_codon:yes gene_type:complete